MRPHDYESSTGVQLNAPEREAERYTVPHTPGRFELAFGTTFAILIVIGLIYAACVIAWGDLALGEWKAVAIIALIGATVPFLTLAWKNHDLMHASINRELAEHFGAIHEAEHYRQMRDMQREQMVRILTPVQAPAAAAARPAGNLALAVVLPNGELIEARLFANWAGRGDLRIEAAKLNDIGRATWEGMCRWLSDNGLATVTSQGVTGKLVASPEMVRAKVFQAALPEEDAQEIAQEIKDRLDSEATI